MIWLDRIIAGGQAGAARAALDFALQHGIAHGGWCPRGRVAADGPIPPMYQLKETPLNTPFQSTEWNVRDSDATVVFSSGAPLAGSCPLVAASLAQMSGKPWLHLSPAQAQDAPVQLARFIEENHVRVLHVVGPGGLNQASIGAFVAAILREGLTLPWVYLVQAHQAEAWQSLLEREIHPRCLVRAFNDPREALQRFLRTSWRPELLVAGDIFRSIHGVILFDVCKRVDPFLKVVLFAASASLARKWFEKERIRPNAYVQKTANAAKNEVLLLNTVQALLGAPAWARMSSANIGRFPISRARFGREQRRGNGPV